MREKTYKLKYLYQDRRVAETYDETRFVHPEGKSENEATRDALGRALRYVCVGSSILDIPCGTGRFTRFFIESDFRYCGGDISLEMMRVLMGKEPGVASDRYTGLVCLDTGTLPFTDGSFDCVVSVKFLHFVPQIIRKSILREYRRVSKRWLIVVANHLEEFGFGDRMKIATKRVLGRNTQRYEVREDILGTGWKEVGRERIGTSRRYVGIYEKG